MSSAKGHRNKMLFKGFHHLRYDEMQQLAREFSINNLGCGYMREPFYHSMRCEVQGYCIIKQELGEPHKCTKHIPFRIEDCEFYHRWLNIRQKEMSKLEKL